MGFKYFKLVIKINIKVINPIEKPKYNKILKSNCQTSSNIFSIINLDPITAKKVEIKITDIKIMINSIKDDKIICFFEKPKILKTRF